MSSGRFDFTFYETDDGTIIPLRVQPETLAADFAGTANAGATGPAASGYPSAQVSGSRRGFGIFARYVTVAWTTAPTGYDDRGIVRIPVPIKATFDAIARNGTVSYLGGTGRVVNKFQEEIK